MSLSIFGRRAVSTLRTTAVRRISTTAPVFASGPVNDGEPIDIPTSEIQSTGRKREELIAAAKGEVRFDRAPIEREFGTLENPILVKSGHSSRIVGCQGGVEGGPKFHEVMWMLLEAGNVPSVCSLCGQ